MYVEIVPGDTVKYELDKDSGLLKVDRPQLYSNVCPSPYGLVPRTLCSTHVAALAEERSGRRGLVGDDDPLDILLLTEKDFTHGNILVQANPIGGLGMLDGTEVDDKIVAVMVKDAVYGGVSDIGQLPEPADRPPEALLPDLQAGSERDLARLRAAARLRPRRGARGDPAQPAGLPRTLRRGVRAGASGDRERACERSSSPAAPASSAATSCATRSRATDARVVVLDALTYAGNLESLRRRRRRTRATRSSRATSPTARRVRRGCSASTAPARSSTSPPRRHVDRSIDDPRASCAPTSSAPSSCSRPRAPICGTSPRRRATASASCTSRPTRSTARSGSDGLFSETTPYAPNSPYSASKAGRRPPRARLARDLPAAGAGHQLLEQLRPVPVPREADPADDPERARGHGSCRSTATAATCATGSTSRTTARASCWCCARARRASKYNIGGGNERTNLQVVDALCAAARGRCGRRATTRRSQRGHRSYTGLKTFVADRPGHDRRYAIDADEDPARARLVAAARLRERAARDGALVPRQPPLVRGGAGGQVPAGAAGAGDELTRLGYHHAHALPRRPPCRASR